MADTDNAKSNSEFKKLSKNIGDKLHKEKGWYILVPLSTFSPTLDLNLRAGRVFTMRPSQARNLCMFTSV